MAYRVVAYLFLHCLSVFVFLFLMLYFGSSDFERNRPFLFIWCSILFALISSGVVKLIRFNRSNFVNISYFPWIIFAFLGAFFSCAFAYIINTSIDGIAGYVVGFIFQVFSGVFFAGIAMVNQIKNTN